MTIVTARGEKCHHFEEYKKCLFLPGNRMNIQERGFKTVWKFQKMLL
jgi:hypothetical protein